MSVIRVLPAEIAGRIAAGEVIERPASVVKELVENSIDAGATRIRVQIEQGGQRLIQVTDNGCGMDRQDALMCLEAHATSKMSKDGDVGQISTLGFRGEAIPSIASVSRFQLQTRRREDDVGTEVIVDNGVIRDVTDCGCAPGTNIRVGHLFGNLPVRRKFMKGPDTEEGHIEEMMMMLALARPDIAFTLSLGGHEVLSTTATNDLAARVRMVLGREAFEAMIPLDYEEDGIVVRGFVSKPGFTRSSRHEQRMIINGRAAAAETLYFAIREAYDTLVLKGRYPGTVLYLDMAPDQVDVNVHPAKREVRFRNPRQVGAIVATAIRTALRQIPGMNADSPAFAVPFNSPQEFRPPIQQQPLPFDTSSETPQSIPQPNVAPAPAMPSSEPQDAVRNTAAEKKQHAVPVETLNQETRQPLPSIPSVQPGKEGPAGTSNTGQPQKTAMSLSHPSTIPSFEPMQPGLPSLQPPAIVSQPDIQRPTVERGNGMPMPPPANRGGLAMSVRGRLGSRYILAETSHGLAIVDVRAAHQRILFEKLLNNLEGQKIMRQQLLLPVTLNLSQPDARLMNSELKQFDAIGFSIEPFGGQTFIVTAVPADFPNQDIVKALLDILEDLRQDRSIKTPNALHLAQIASRHAVCVKDNLSDEEIRQMLHELSGAQMPYADPAGNPTMVHITYSELDKRFNRNGSNT